MTGSLPPARTVPDRPPGAFVLGMHRSGTSVVAGVLDRLGLDGGDRTTMFDADEFNTDGYWEQRPVVALHDAMLRRLGGYPSAPPAQACGGVPAELVPGAPQEIIGLVDRLYRRPWFVKDPRQCLLLPVWRAALGDDDLAIVVSRDPRDVVRSLQHRNGYSAELAAGLWERYMLDLLAGLAGRPCLVVRYERLLDDPVTCVTEIADAVSRHVGVAGVGNDDAVRAGVDLVRPRDRASSTRGRGPDRSSVGLRPEQRALDAVLDSLVGHHPRFAVPSGLPALSDASRRLIARRRTMLRLARTVVGRDPESRSRLDRRRR